MKAVQTLFIRSASSPAASVTEGGGRYDRYETLPLPQVIEDDSEQSWAMWKAATETADAWSSKTVPMELREE